MASGVEKAAWYVLTSIGLVVATPTGGWSETPTRNGTQHQAPDAGSDTTLSAPNSSQVGPTTSEAKKRAPCDRLTLELDRGISPADVAAIRRALALKSTEVVIGMHYVDRRHSRVEVSTNHGRCYLSGGSIYTLARTKGGWRWLRNMIGGFVY
jgi:hypothetical protein